MKIKRKILIIEKDLTILKKLKTFDFTNQFSDSILVLSEISDLTSLYEFRFDLIILNLEDINFNFDLLKVISEKYPLICLSSNNEFKNKSYENGVIDFIYYPQEFDRLKISINNISKLLHISKDNFENIYLNIKVKKLTKKIRYDDITYIEAMGNYIKIVVNSNNVTNSIIILEKISIFEQKINNNNFIRIHKSFIVNILHIKLIRYKIVILNDNIILPIGRTFRSQFVKFYNSH